MQLQRNIANFIQKRIQYAYFVDHDNPEFKARWNQIRNVPRVFTPDDKVVQIPNSDTPYSTLGLDLRTEPMVNHRAVH